MRGEHTAVGRNVEVDLGLAHVCEFLSIVCRVRGGGMKEEEEEESQKMVG